MRIDAISIGTNPPEDINVIVEVPIGGEPVKYEMDKEAGAMIVDRILYTAMQYPGNYGFVPHTISDDGDPIDVLIVNQRTIMPGAVINCRPIGALMMKDEAGHDEKLIAVPSERVSQLYNDIRDIEDIPEIQRDRIAHFFEHYKDLEGGKWVQIDRWVGAREAQDLIRKAIETANGV